MPESPCENIPGLENSNVMIWPVKDSQFMAVAHSVDNHCVALSFLPLWPNLQRILNYLRYCPGYENKDYIDPRRLCHDRGFSS